MPTGVCCATGHVVDDDAKGPYCEDHGASIITHCGQCWEAWKLTKNGERGVDFCPRCNLPASWVSRSQLIDWIKHRVSETEEFEERAKLLEALDRIKALDSDDARALAGWDMLRKTVPSVWEFAKPVLTKVMGAYLLKRLGLE